MVKDRNVTLLLKSMFQVMFMAFIGISGFELFTLLVRQGKRKVSTLAFIHDLDICVIGLRRNKGTSE